MILNFTHNKTDELIASFISDYTPRFNELIEIDGVSYVVLALSRKKFNTTDNTLSMSVYVSRG